MVFKTLVSLSKTATKCSASPFTPIKNPHRRQSWTDESRPPHPFFKPSYATHRDLTIAENVARENEDDYASHDYWEHFARPHSSVVTNYVFIYDPSFLSFDQFKQSRDRVPNRKLVNGRPGLQPKGLHYLSNLRRDDTAVFSRAFTTMSYNQGVVKDDFTIYEREQIAEDKESAAAAVEKPQNQKFQKVQKPLEEAQKLQESSPIQVSQEAAPIFDKQQKSDQPPSLDSSPSSLESFEDFVCVQTDAITQYMAAQKFNEVYAVYQHLASHESADLPVEVYADVLAAIAKRTGTRETIEEQLTLLLEVYSALLQSGKKPNAQVYSTVISSLLKGSRRSFAENDSANGAQFYQVASELLTIRKEQEFESEVYNDLVFCMNAYGPGSLTAREVHRMCTGKASQDGAYFVGMMRLCQHEFSLLQDLYAEYTHSCSENAEVRRAKPEVYAAFVQGLVTSTRDPALATAFMDKVIKASKATESQLSQTVSPMLSSFVVALADVELGLAREAVAKFDSIDWLPDVDVHCLVHLAERCADEQKFNLALRFWTLAVSRADFDASVSDVEGIGSILRGVNGEYYGAVISSLVDKMIMLDHRSNVMRLARDAVQKKSLVLPVQAVANVVEYLKSWGPESNNLIQMLVIAQGERAVDKNGFLSAVIDFVPEVSEICKSKFFRDACESFRLTRDNVYGIKKVTERAEISEYLRKVVRAEFEDLDNYYVQLPREMIDFKQSLLG
ncbi:unnamed protein product [Kuraishia capsulata CBS 1993]|uniref:Uncharacterized protein n=1 Tax=Kuraishia capsulata CBS 1993 TaxID=1382522 RepID=W6MTS9_9ASCO|nr:uncharacterized protein KUCA_T00004631001 [Kuraishia capsulata CBS 1993]CDK28647.1 unnamed protein product [Kuraishia capsulata CBS 1993]